MARGNLYSTTVAWAKVALPLIALALLSTLFLLSRSPDPDDALPFAEVDVDQLVREQRLSRPRFAGTLDDGREVTLVADTAAAVQDPNTILLTAVESRLSLSEGEALLLSAERGDLELASQVVVFDGSVIAVVTTGYRMSTDRLAVGLDTMRLTAPQAIALTGPGLTLEAGAMTLTGPDGASFLSFTGGVRLLYLPQE